MKFQEQWSIIMIFSAFKTLLASFTANWKIPASLAQNGRNPPRKCKVFARESIHVSQCQSIESWLDPGFRYNRARWLPTCWQLTFRQINPSFSRLYILFLWANYLDIHRFGSKWSINHKTYIKIDVKVIFMLLVGYFVLLVCLWLGHSLHHMHRWQWVWVHACQ
jgi:hypothetical protein